MKVFKLAEGRTALVDDEDYDRLSEYKWKLVKRQRKNGLMVYYVQACKSIKRKQKEVLMHRVIMNAPVGIPLDHKNGDGLNNQRSNLRFCTHQQNLMNKNVLSRKNGNSTSCFKGVSLDKRILKWQAKIMFNKKSICLGYYVNEEDAARAYDTKALELFGEFARINSTDIKVSPEIRA